MSKSLGDIVHEESVKRLERIQNEINSMQYIDKWTQTDREKLANLEAELNQYQAEKGGGDE